MRESSQIAAENRDRAPHAHRTGAEHLETKDHLTGHERSRQDLEHSNKAYLQAQRKDQENRTFHATTGIANKVEEEAIAALAYELWQRRNCPIGSPEVDWYCAVEQLRAPAGFTARDERPR